MKWWSSDRVIGEAKAVWGSSVSDEEERWRKATRKTATVGRRALPLFPSAAQNNHKPGSSLSIYLSIYLSVKKQEWRRKKEWERGRSAGKEKEKLAHPHGSEPSENANRKRQYGRESFHSVKGSSGSDVIITRSLAEPEQGELKAAVLSCQKEPCRAEQVLSTHAGLSARVQRHFQIFPEASAISLELNRTPLCAGTVFAVFQLKRCQVTEECFRRPRPKLARWLRKRTWAKLGRLVVLLLELFQLLLLVSSLSLRSTFLTVRLLLPSAPPHRAQSSSSV